MAAETLRDVIRHGAEAYGEQTAFRYKVKKEIIDKSYNEVNLDSMAVSRAVEALGMKGKHIAVIGTTSYPVSYTHLDVYKRQEEYAANARKAVEEGYDAIKIDFFTFDRKDGRRFDKITETTGILKQYYVGLVEERVAAVREAVGPDVDIIMENHSVPDANGAVQLARAVEKYNICLLYTSWIS